MFVSAFVLNQYHDLFLLFLKAIYTSFMKKSLTIFSITLICQISLAQTFLFEISSPSNPRKSYLFGTMHETNPKVFNFNDSLFWCIRQADKAIFELDLSPESLREVAPFMNAEEELEQKFYDFMNGFATGIVNNLIPRMIKEVTPEEMVDRMIRLLPEFKIAVKDIQEQFTGSRNTEFLDLYLQNYARSQEKEIIGLETMSEQLFALFKDVLSYDPGLAAKELSDEMIEFMKSDKPMPGLASFMQSQKRFIDLYANRDFNGVCDTVNNLGQHSHTLMKKFYKSVFVDRNNIMFERLLPMITQNSMFIAVGAGHLCGDNGLINAFLNDGYQVRPINTAIQSTDKRSWELHANPSHSFSVKLPSNITPYRTHSNFMDFLETTEAIEDTEVAEPESEWPTWSAELDDEDFYGLSPNLLNASYLFTNKGLIAFSVASTQYDPREPDIFFDEDISDWDFSAEDSDGWTVDWDEEEDEDGLDVAEPEDPFDDIDFDSDLMDMDFKYNTIKPPYNEELNMPPPPPPVPDPSDFSDVELPNNSPRIRFTKIIEESLTKTEVAAYIQRVQEVAKERIQQYMEVTGENPLDFSLIGGNPFSALNMDDSGDSTFVRKAKKGKKNIELTLSKNWRYDEFAYSLTSVIPTKDGLFHTLTIQGDKHIILSEEFNEFFFSFEKHKSKKTKKSTKDKKNSSSKKNSKKSKK
jgi:uncharacterized protein YbaP (TraB family)